MWIDSHCHLDRLINCSLDSALEAAWNHQVSHILTVSVTLDDFPHVLEITNQYPHKISCSVGLHPSENAIKEPSVDDIIRLSKNLAVVAIGETGLDYHYDDVDFDIQRARLRTHINAAMIVSKPLIIHLREAEEDLFAILKEEQADKISGVFHCFTGDWEAAKKALDLGFYLGFSGIVTFKNAESLREVARKIPLDRILIETDAPYLSPVPMRGKPNEPAFVRYVAEFMADLRNMRCDEFSEKTTDNFYRLFRRKEA